MTCPPPTSVCKRCRTIVWRAEGACIPCAAWLERCPPDRNHEARRPDEMRAWAIALVVLGLLALVSVEAMREPEAEAANEDIAVDVIAGAEVQR